MPSVAFINEPVLVEARLLAGGQTQPLSFHWRGELWRVIEIGRAWQEEVDGTSWRCYLVHTIDGSRFELRLDVVAARWILARAWLTQAFA